MALFFLTLKKEIFSIKSFVIGGLFIVVSVLAGKYTTSVSIFLNSNRSSGLIDLLFGIYGFLGYIFSSVLFSGLISKEVESQTMRYVTPYLSRKAIYLAKYFASLCYFLIILAVSLVVLFLFRGAVVFPIYSILSIIAFLLISRVSCYSYQLFQKAKGFQH